MTNESATVGYRLIVPPLERQLAMDVFAALPSGHPMVGLLELDVTTALESLTQQRQAGERVSLFAFVVSAVARAIAEHPDMNLVCHGRRLVLFDDVDIGVPVEVRTRDGDFPHQMVIRRAQDLTPAQIYAQLEASKHRQTTSGSLGKEDRWVRRVASSARVLPRFFRTRLAGLLMNDAFRIKAHAGTTLVSSVGKFAEMPGAAFSLITGPRASTFLVGGVAEKPWVVDGQIVPRSILSLSVLVNHDLVDGAPAARFATRLKQLIESGEGLDTPARSGTTPPARRRA